MPAYCPAHHPGPELLLDYASGALAEPLALLAASHAALCPDCRSEVAGLEALGGALFETLEAAPLAAGALARTLARLPEAADAPPAAPACDDPSLPRPLRGYLAGNLDSLAWRGFGGLAEHRLLTDFPGFTTRLLCVRGGTAVPQHSHDGNEYVLLLAGGFSDVRGHYRRGDVALTDASVDHRPRADPVEDCLCLAVTDAPLRLTGRLRGRFGRSLNRLLRL